MGAEDPFSPTGLDLPLPPGAEPPPLGFGFVRAARAIERLEGVLRALDRVLDRHRDLLEHALEDFDGRSGEAFRARTDLLLRRWVVERDRVAREIESIESQVTAARARVEARSRERTAWRGRRDAWHAFVSGG